MNVLDASTAEGGNLINLDQAVKDQLQSLTNHMDEYAQVDPQIVISASLSISEHFTAFLEEAVPFSQFILARVLKARFVVRVTPKIKTQPIPFDDPDLGLRVEPYTGQKARGQPFGVESALEEASQDVEDDRWMQIRGHMLSLGVLSSASVVSPEFIEDQTDVFKDILSGKLRIVKPVKRARPGERDDEY